MGVLKDERIDIGRRLYHRELDFSEARHEYYVTETALRNWVREYKLSAGITDPGWVISNQKLTYEEMSKEQLIDELLKKDIENERLKKGYEVKGAGADKEFVTTSDANTK